MGGRAGDHRYSQAAAARPQLLFQATISWPNRFQGEPAFKRLVQPFRQGDVVGQDVQPFGIGREEVG
jgi:hypothetical protein